MPVGLGYQMARHQQEDLLALWGGDPATGRAPVPSLAAPEEEWRAWSAV